MNKVYRTVFNEKTNTWVAVAETAKAHGKSGRSGGVVAAVADGMLLNKKMLTVSAAVAAAMAAQPAMADNARIENGSAQSTIAISPSNTTAGSGGAKATGNTSIAAGWNAKATGVNSMALGYNASTETDPISAVDPRISKLTDKMDNNVAIGSRARSGGFGTIAFGPDAYAARVESIAVGSSSQATGDQSVALGANTHAKGNSSVAIGGDDLDSVASTVYRETSATADNDAYNNTPVAQIYRRLTGHNLVDFTPGNRYIRTTSGQAAVAVGVSAKAADLATAIGTKSHAAGNYSAALGVGANATLANAVALGAGSTTATNATDVSSATIGAITYGGGASPFAGSGKVTPGDQVSVGSASFERQIKHVAPGAITAASTDAINGSQLFYVTQGLQNQIGSLGFGVNADNNSLKTHRLGKELAIVAGNTTETTSTSNLKTNVTQDAATGKTTVTVSMKDAPTFASVTTQDAAGNKTVTNAGGVTITPVSGSPVRLTKDGLNNGNHKITGVADGTVAAGSKEAVNGSQLHDLKENGFKISDGTTSDTVKLTETVTYKGDSNIVTTVTDNQVGFKLANSITVGPATGGNPVTVDGNAGTVTGLTNKTWDPNNITSGRGATEDQLKAAQAAATSKVAAGKGISVTPNVDATTGSTTYTVAADTTALNVGDGTGGNPAGKVITPTGADANKLATAGDIANAINNSGFNINAGGNVVGTSTATTAKPGSTLTLKAGDGLTVKQELDGNGNQSYTYAVNAQTVVQNAQTPVVYTKADGTKVYKRPDGKFYDAPTGGHEVAAGDVIASMQNAAGNTTTPTTLANVKSNLADAATATTNPANNDRAALTANNKGNNAATVNDVLNAGFTVQGNGTNKDFVTHGDTINFANGQGTVANVSTTGGVTTVKFDTPMTYADAAGNPTNTPSNKVNMVGGTAGSPVTLGNVADGNIAAGSKEAVNGGQLHATNQNVAKGINFGGTTGSNNYRLGDTINVKGDSNIISETVAGGAQLKLADVLSVGQAAPVKIDGDKGEVSGLSNTTLGGNDFAQGKRAATEEQLNAAQDQLVNVLGGNAANNGGNISMTDIGGTGENNIHDAIKAVNATANLPLTFGGDSGKDVERKPGTKLNIVGGQTDAAKLSDGNIGVVANGSDKLEVKLAKDLAVDSVKAGDTTVNTDGVKVGDVNLTKAGLNNGGNKITNVAAGTDDTDAVNVAQLNKAAAAAKTEVVQGDNIVVTQDVGANGQTIYKVATDKNLKVDSVTAGDTVMNNDGVKVGDDVALNKDGLKAGDVNLTKAGLNNGGNKITNVAAGTDDTDAVNVSQLKQAAAASKTEVVQGKNIVVTEKTGDKGQTVYEVATDKDLDVDSVKAGDTTVNNDGVKVGDDVALNKDGLKAGKVNLTKDGLDNAGNKVTNVADGDLNANSKDAVNGSQLYATNQNVANNAATIAKGINFGGTTGSNNYALGDTINVKGDSNIISKTVAGGAQLKLADEISVKTVNADTFKAGDTVMNNDGVKVGDKVALNKDGLTAGNTVVNNDGVTIAAPTENNPNNQVKLSPVGLNNGGQRITNVAPGKDGTDAANVNQLIGLGTELQNNINQVGKKAYAGVAGAIAQGSIPQVTRPGATGIGVGSGYYGGQSAMAIGVSAMSDGGNWIVKGNFSANTDGHVGVGAGALYQW